MKSPLGLCALFDPPTSRAGLVSVERVLDRVADRVLKYRDFADRHDVPSVAAAGAHCGSTTSSRSGRRSGTIRTSDPRLRGGLWLTRSSSGHKSAERLPLEGNCGGF